MAIDLWISIHNRCVLKLFSSLNALRDNFGRRLLMLRARAPASELLWHQGALITNGLWLLAATCSSSSRLKPFFSRPPFSLSFAAQRKKAKVNCNKHNFSISWNVVWLLRSFLHFKLFRAVKFTAMFCSGRLCPIVCAARKKPTVDGAATQDEIEMRQFGMPQVSRR